MAEITGHLLYNNGALSEVKHNAAYNNTAMSEYSYDIITPNLTLGGRTNHKFIKDTSTGSLIDYYGYFCNIHDNITVWCVLNYDTSTPVCYQISSATIKHHSTTSSNTIETSLLIRILGYAGYAENAVVTYTILYGGPYWNLGISDPASYYYHHTLKKYAGVYVTSDLSSIDSNSLSNSVKYPVIFTFPHAHNNLLYYGAVSFLVDPNSYINGGGQYDQNFFKGNYLLSLQFTTKKLTP